jgi:hypothetical protein
MSDFIIRSDIDGFSPKSLPSWYRGIEFRSRMEARWAAYFDTLYLNWIYEPEGYSLKSGNYCPDFQLGNLFIEVKPTIEAANNVLDKLMELSGLLPYDDQVYCVIGNPSSLCIQWGVTKEGVITECGFNWRAFVYKQWGIPQFCGDTIEVEYEDEYNLRLVYSMRFENGICNDDLRGKGHPKCR